MKTIVIVNTQLQLLNSVECLSHLNINEADIILYAQGKVRMSQLNKLLKLEIFRIFFSKIYRLTNYFEKDRIVPWLSFLFIWDVCRRNKYDNCIIGHYLFSTSKHLIRMCRKFNPHVNIYVVDDGMASLEVAEKRTKELQTMDPVSCMTIEGRLLRRYMKSRSEQYVAPNLVFFTVFNELNNSIDNFVCNRYEYINKHLTDVSINPDFVQAEVVILGQPLYLNNGIKYEDYMKYIRKVVKQNFDSKIIYYPHPEEKLDENSFSVLPNIRLMKNEYSIEVMSRFLPNCKKIIGFYTSALVTLKYFRPDIEMQSIVVSSEDVEEAFYPIYEKCYKDFVNRNITLLEFL